MNIIIEHHSGVPIFRQLQEQVKLAILSGLWKPGDEVPSTRNLSESLKVNPMTISKAFSQLEQDGWLERRRGLPTIVNPQLDPALLESSKQQMLRDLLEPTVMKVRQLSIDPEQAIQVWKDMLS